MKKIVIVSGIQLSDNPRVVKEAATLAQAGFDVEVLTALLLRGDQDRNDWLAQQYSFRTRRMIDVSRTDPISRLDWYWKRLKRKAVLTACRVSGRESIHQLGYTAKSLLKCCLAERADLYSIHLPQAMWVGAQLIRRGAKVSVDIEDWYSEDYRQSEAARFPLKLMRSNESAVLNGSVFSSTTSHALSNALVKSYGCPAPIVLYNAFRLTERGPDVIPPSKREPRHGLPRIGWVSQVVGPERGLEQLIAATHFLKQPIQIHLTGRVRPGMEESLRAALHSSCSLQLQGQVPHQELLSLMQTYDIGFAGELAHNRSRDLTVTNKILHYFLAGVPAVASDTQGQLEICRQVPDAVRVYSQYDPRSLATSINSLLESPDTLKKAKQVAWDVATEKFCWEANECRLLDAVLRAIGSPN